MKKSLLWFVPLLILVWEMVQYWPNTIHIHLSGESFSIKMPLKDKKRLDWFFRDACFLNLWAYTLMGSKPMSTHQYTKPGVAFKKGIQSAASIFFGSLSLPNMREICYLINPVQLKIKLGWEILNNYMNYFPNSRFALFTYFSDGDVVFLALVDKIKLIDIVKFHIQDFQGVLQLQNLSPEDLSLNKNVDFFLSNLNSDGLFGTLLGFGRENAWLFQQYKEKDPKDCPMVSMWENKEESWLEKINEKDLSFEPWEPTDLFYPPFACNPNSEETKQLNQTYLKEREQILQYYKDKDLVEATLNLFAQTMNQSPY